MYDGPEQINKFILRDFSNYANYIETLINIYWGLLTPYERNQMLRTLYPNHTLLQF